MAAYMAATDDAQRYASMEVHAVIVGLIVFRRWGWLRHGGRGIAVVHSGADTV